MIKILKVRMKESATKIDYTHEGTKVSIVSDELASETFSQALADLKPLVKSIVGVTDAWMDKVTVTGISLTPSGEDNYRVVITTKREMAVGSPLNLPTPYRLLHPSEDKEESKLGLSEENARLVNEVCEQARLYVQGLRPQRQLYLFEMKPTEGKIVEGDFTEEPKKKRGRKPQAAPEAEREAAAAR